MSKMTECGRSLEWAGGTYDFDLGAERALKILRGEHGVVPLPFMARGYFNEPLAGQFGSTPAACLRRFHESVYSVSDVERLIEIGLYGGGMNSQAAVDLVDQHVRGKPLAPNALVAQAVLLSLFSGA